MYRYIYHFGCIEYEEYTKHKPIVKEYITCDIISRINKLGINDEHTLNIFLSIGAIFKSRLVTSTGFRSFIETISLGIDIYEQHIKKKIVDTTKNPDDGLMLIYYSHIINSINSKKIKKWYVIKDTTASINQHAGKLLGFKSEALEYVNLTNTTKYFDTYELFISELLKYILIKKPKQYKRFKLLLNRKLLKQLIMTIGYSIGQKHAYVD